MGSESPTATYVTRWITCQTSYGSLRLTATIDEIPTRASAPSATTLKSRSEIPSSEAISRNRLVELSAA